MRLAHFSGHSDSIIFFTLIVVCLLLGVDLSRKLYKNSLAHGISRTEFFLSKTLVSFVVAIFQFILLLGLSFIIASSINGIGTAPTGFFGQFLLTILVQLMITIAWIGIVSFVLYLTPFYCCGLYYLFCRKRPAHLSSLALSSYRMVPLFNLTIWNRDGCGSCCCFAS